MSEAIFRAQHLLTVATHRSARTRSAVRTGHGEQQDQDDRGWRQFPRHQSQGYVAVLQLDDGRVLTEGPAIVQYLADLKPGAGLAPLGGTWERTRLQESLNYITSEIHAGASPLFNAAIPDDVKTIFRDRLVRRLTEIASTLGSQHYLDRFAIRRGRRLSLHRAALDEMVCHRSRPVAGDQGLYGTHRRAPGGPGRSPCRIGSGVRLDPLPPRRVCHHSFRGIPSRSYPGRTRIERAALRPMQKMRRDGMSRVGNSRRSPRQVLTALLWMTGQAVAAQCGSTSAGFGRMEGAVRQ